MLLVPQFAMMFSLKDKFPLHLIVFKQTASHIPQPRTNVEQFFSRSGNLTDLNMDPHFLAILTKIGTNKKAYQPPTKDILAKCYAKYHGSSSKDDGSSSKDHEEGDSPDAKPRNKYTANGAAY